MRPRTMHRFWPCCLSPLPCFVLFVCLIQPGCSWSSTAVPPWTSSGCRQQCWLRLTSACVEGRWSRLWASPRSGDDGDDDKISEWTSDFEDYDIGGDYSTPAESSISPPSEDIQWDQVSSSNQNDDEPDSTPDAFDDAYKQVLEERLVRSDATAIKSRQFRLGPDLVLSDFCGSMGFDEVTDWEYYYPSEDDDGSTMPERQVVQPNPFDKSQPKRTRTSSGSVVRLFRGEFVGLLGGMLSSQGLDRRILVKEFSGNLALELARADLESLGQIQSDLLSGDRNSGSTGESWLQAASVRSTSPRNDCRNVVQLVEWLKEKPYLGILGEVNLAEMEDSLDANDFYRALGVPPPEPNAIWIVYEYAGLSTVSAYAQPAQIRRANLPVKRGFFGAIEPPPLPPFADRARYVKGIMKQAIEALATLHESGIVHRSIGRSSLVLTCKAMDKREAASPYQTLTSQLVVKLADFGFSGLYEESTRNEEFCTRARSFQLCFQKGDNTILSTNFAMAEDMHALGFVFLGLLLGALAELPTPGTPMPAVDEDTFQRLFADIFGSDIKGEFREYVEAEEVWTPVVELLDEADGAGWTVLETLLLAREKAAASKDTLQMMTVRGLLSNPFFK